MTVRVFILALCLSALTAFADGADILIERIQNLGVNRESLFPAPPSNTFPGYILFADPYDPKTNQISFLLGTDCSHFVHRLMQLLGMEYSFLKTANFIDFAQGDHHLLTEEQRVVANSRWEVISEAEAKPGDIMVTGKFRPLENTERGHMGIITETHPIKAIQSAIRKGIVDEPYGPREGETPYFFRYKGPVKELDAETLGDLLALKYAQVPTFCEAVFKP